MECFPSVHYHVCTNCHDNTALPELRSYFLVPPPFLAAGEYPVCNVHVHLCMSESALWGIECD